jgi:FkbM family methyltransferase
MEPNTGGVLETLYARFIRGPYWHLKLRSHPRMERTIADRDVAFVLENPGHRQYHEFESESRVVRDVVSELRKGDVFYDIGANIGLYSCVVSTVLAEPNVVAFEPSPPAFSKLDKNARLNGSQFRRYQLAVSDADVKTTLAVDTDNTYARMSTLQAGGEDDSIRPDRGTDAVTRFSPCGRTATRTDRRQNRRRGSRIRCPPGNGQRTRRRATALL